MGIQELAMRDRLNRIDSQLADLRRHRSDGILVPFVPVLTAATVNPNIGDTGAALAGYSREGDKVFYQGSITFNGAGIVAGTGRFYISLPYISNDAVISGTGLAGGHWRMTSGATLQRDNDVVIFPGEQRMRCRYAAAFPSGAETEVGGANPWVWVAGNRIEWEVWYYAAPY